MESKTSRTSSSNVIMWSHTRTENPASPTLLVSTLPDAVSEISQDMDPGSREVEISHYCADLCGIDYQADGRRRHYSTPASQRDEKEVGWGHEDVLLP